MEHPNHPTHPTHPTHLHGRCEVCGLVPIARRLRGAAHVVARSEAMQGVLKRAARFAATEAPVAILGETGSGKEVVARIVHANSSRAAQPFVAVNVAALPAELLESELFGHGKGAFTGADVAHRGLFEAADKGVLFLDEIGEMTLPLQAKLLRALQDGELRRVGETRAFTVDVRVICATHRDLGERVRQGTFREDLFYRLKVLTLEVPSLRDRQADILPLAHRLLADEHTSAKTFSPGAKARLLAHAWPGNVRELQNVVKHGAALATGPEVDVDDLPGELLRTPRAAPPRAPSSDAAILRPLATLAEVEREHILRVVDACGGSPSEAARVLGIARNTLWRKLREAAATERPAEKNPSSRGGSSSSLSLSSSSSSPSTTGHHSP
jgi:two-component system response regulator HydG